MNKNNSWSTLGVLIKRNVKLYLKDRMTVFFSVLAPIIILLLYVLFLGDLQVESIMSMLEANGIELELFEVKAIVNNWMISGVMGVSCITVALNANVVMVRDRQTGIVNDIIASPVKHWVLYLSYIISCFILTFAICFIVLMLSIAFLAGTGGLMMSFSDFLVILCVTIISVLSSSFFMVLICGFIKSVGSMSALNGVFSAACGFLIGAYLPFSMMPKYMEYLACFIPGTYSAGLFRNYFMGGVIDHLGGRLPENIMTTLRENFSMRLELFGTEITTGWMVFTILGSILLFATLIAIIYLKKRNSFFTFTKSGKRKNKKVAVTNEKQNIENKTAKKDIKTIKEDSIKTNDKEDTIDVVKQENKNCEAKENSDKK